MSAYHRRTLLLAGLLAPLAAWARSLPNLDLADIVVTAAASGAQTSLAALMHGQRTVLLAVDGSNPAALAWVEAQLLGLSEPQLDELLVLLVLPTPTDPQEPLPSWAHFPGLRLYRTDVQGGRRLGQGQALPVMLGFGADGSLLTRLVGQRPRQPSLAEFSKALRRQTLSDR
jgi:hypothetical protein